MTIKLKRGPKIPKRKYDKGLGSVPVLICDLRALLFWASVGVYESCGGSYQDVIETEGDMGILNSYAEQIKFKLPYPPHFRMNMTRTFRTLRRAAGKA